MKQKLSVLLTLLIAILVLAACTTPTAEVVTVVETVEVEVVTEKEVEVEVVTEKEVVVEVEVTKEVVVEQIVQVTPIPAPFENQEAPMLAARVKQGALPPLAERLPEEPLVLPGDIGQYGGVWRQAHLGPNDSFQNVYWMREGPMTLTADYSGMMPGVFKDWEANDDATVWTFYLRQGHKWSDGSPFTTDDVMFWFNDFILNEELNPAPPAYLQAGGEMGVFEQVDETTFTVTFVQSYAIFDVQISGMYSQEIYLPGAYLKQFHPNYASEEELAALMEAGGFDTWVDLFKYHTDRFSSPYTPCIRAWCEVNTDDQAVHIMERNPYYYAVDTAGNQLPYIDRVERTITSDSEGILLRALAGEVDFGARRFASDANKAVLLENAEQGNYRLADVRGSDHQFGLHLNLNHPDPVMNELFNTLDFRIALSLGIDRDEVCQVIYKGLCQPMQTVMGPSTHYFDESHNTYSEYDLDTANGLLDDLGLAERDADGFRLRSDGERLAIVLLSHGEDWVEMGEFIKEDWAEMGIEVVVRSADRQLWREQVHAYQHDIGLYYVGFGHYGSPPYFSNTFFTTSGYHESPAWSLYYETGGAEGVEPPAEVQELQALYDQFMSETDLAAQDDIIAQALQINAENIWSIGVVHMTATPFILVKNNMGNVSEPVGFYGRATKTAMFYYMNE